MKIRNSDEYHLDVKYNKPLRMKLIKGKTPTDNRKLSFNYPVGKSLEATRKPDHY